MRPRSPVLLLVLSLLVGAGCVRLGFWQLDRLSQRRARNARAHAQLALPPLELGPDAQSEPVETYRRVRLAGKFDFSREVVLTARPREGSPGVHLATPVPFGQSDSLVLVLRGWVYSPDAATVNLAQWREPDSVRIEGYALAYDPDRPMADSSTVFPRAVRRLDHALLQRRFGRPLAGFYVVMTGGGPAGAGVPARLAEPALDEGPHLSYAIQWFLFATIFGAGGAVVWWRGRKRMPLAADA